MDINPRVSVIVPTKNSSAHLEQCLLSIRSQTYRNIELIVVDNFSTDTTLAIAKKYTDAVYTLGPERSTQRNAGVRHATGSFVVLIDSDMTLGSQIIEQCVLCAQATNAAGVVIPERSVGEGFWAQCKQLERSFYVEVEWMEAARFFSKTMFERLGGYNEQMVSGEDWDLSQRAQAQGKLSRIKAYIDHQEGRIRLTQTIQKKYYYAKHFSTYVTEHTGTPAARKQTSVFSRYKLFFSDPKKLFRHPLYGLGMLYMKTCEFAAGAFGLLTS